AGPALQPTACARGQSFFSAQQSRLAERTGQKIVLQRQFADFGMKRFDINGWPCRFRLVLITENAGRPLKELVFPLLNLVGMHVELLGQFHQCLLASNGGKRHLCLESRAVVPAWSSRHGISCSRHLSRSQAEIPLISAVQISRTTSIRSLCSLLPMAL